MSKEKVCHPLKKDELKISNSEKVEEKIYYPLKKDDFKFSDAEKIEKIESHFRSIMDILGLDLNDDSLAKTPRRIAKMYVKDIFSGLKITNKPNNSVFENKYRYNQMLIERNIMVYSTCEHHFLPIIGKAHVAYISKNEVVGLSKINRIVDYYAKRPQVQERLTLQIVKAMQDILATKDVACIIDAKHLCVNSRGIRDVDSSTITYELGGLFKDDVKIRNEFFNNLHIKTSFNG